jgi:hypothetical protein
MEVKLVLWIADSNKKLLVLEGRLKKQPSLPSNCLDANA